MTSKVSNGDVFLSTYAARIRGDLEAMMTAFAEDAVYEFNGRGTGVPTLSAPAQGKSAIRSAMQGMIESFRFNDWRAISLISDGDKAMLHWRAMVTMTANGKTAEFDVFDVATFRDGKVVALHQSTDTAMIMAMLAS